MPTPTPSNANRAAWPGQSLMLPAKTVPTLGERGVVELPLQPGEVGVIPLIASDRAQARNSLGYLKGLAAMPLVGLEASPCPSMPNGSSLRRPRPRWRLRR